VYVTLLRHGPLSGYEVSRHSGVPRPNVYPVLQRLIERGAVEALTARRGARYAARPAAAFLAGLERSYQERLGAAAAALARIDRATPEPVAVAVAGRDELLARARRLIDAATARLVLAVAPATAPLLSAEAVRAVERGVAVTTLCLEACPAPCGACHGDLFRQDMDDPTSAHWLVAIADDREVVAADLSDAADGATGIATRHPALVRLALRGIQDGIAAAEIVRALGAGLLDAVGPPVERALAGAPLADSHRRSWLERMRGRLGLVKV
jgi:sugar-specific transcriptional regulator TrmB